MAYKLKPRETVRTGLVRCAREQLQRAATELSDGFRADPASAVHEARKALKQERSLLRLMRGSMAAGQRKHENETLRQTGRSLSGTRDAEVMVQTVDDLAARFGDALPDGTFGVVRQRLADRRDAGMDEDARVAALLALREVTQRTNGWKLQDGGWEAIETGLARSYRRGRKAFRHSRAHPTLENLHGWRKRVKDLWYHEKLLAAACGPTIRGQAKDAHQLADLLGDDHDLGVLRAAVAEDRWPPTVDLDGLLRLIDLRRSQLQAEAIAIGDRVYAEKPRAFVRRVRRHWRAGRRASREAARREPARRLGGEVALP